MPLAEALVTIGGGSMRVRVGDPSLLRELCDHLSRQGWALVGGSATERATQTTGMGLMFYPRGGSAQVARYLSRALVESGWEVVLASGSLGSLGEQTHAATFFEGLHVEVADYLSADG